MVDLVNRAAGNTGVVEGFDPFITRAGRKILIQCFVQCLTVLQAAGLTGVIGVLPQVFSLKFRAQAIPHGGTRARYIDVAIGGRKDSGRGAGGMVIAGLRWHFTLHQPAGRLKIEHCDLRLNERRTDPLAEPRFLALQ